MKMILAILFLITAVVSVEESETKISTTRNEYRTAICEYYSTTYTTAQKQSLQDLIDSYTYLSSADIQKMIFTLNFSSPAIQTILIALPHAVALVILLIMWPGLCCCCVWPEKYPICKKCRKPEKDLYQKCQLKWPSYATIVIYLLIVTGSSAALYSGPDITNHMNNFGCKLTAVLDDTINGRISPTDDTVFFVGLSPLKDELTTFNGSYNTFFSESNTSLNGSQDIRNRQTAIQTTLELDYSSYTDVTYSNAFTQSDGVTYVDVDSQFKTMYFGPTTDSSKILGNTKSQLTTIFNQINSALDPMIDAWLVLQAQQQSETQLQIDQTVDNITLFVTGMNLALDVFGPFFNIGETFTWANTGIKIFYGLILALAILGGIATVVIACCSVVRARHIVYCTCTFLLLLGFISFILLIVTAILLPNFSQVCRYVDNKLSTGAGTVELFKSLQFQDAANLYADCMSDGNGDVITQLNDNFTDPFDSIVLISRKTLQFNDLIPSFSTEALERPFTQGAAVIDSVNISEVLDIQDTIGINFLESVASKAYTLDPIDCTNTANVNADSWTPSFEVIDCEGGSFKQPPCTDLSDTVVCPVGCYEIFDQLTSASGDSAAYTTNLQTRYGTDCNYADYVINLHDNWNKPRMTYLGTVQDTLDSQLADVSGYDTAVKTIQASLNSFKSNLQTNFESETNLTAGSFNGVDCTVVGQSIIEFRDSACVGILGSIQYNFIMLIIISYSILLLGCFSICTGVRHFQHLQKMQVKVGYKGVPISISSNRILDKFDK